MLNILKDELDKFGAFNTPKHPFVDALVRAVPFGTVPNKMKIVFALSHLSNYASQFRRSLELWDGTLVPANNISFVVADSGANKDSTNSKIKKCFSEGFDILTKKAKEFAKEEAIKAAERAGEDCPTEFAVYKEYLKPVPPVFMTMTTGPGLVQHINDIGALPILSGFTYAGELSDELASNPNALDNIKILAEVYDLGNKEATYTKGAEHRAKEIISQPVSALLVGSPGHILYDEATRKKFQVAFMSKLARRSWFCYTPERVYEKDFSKEKNPIKAMQEYESRMEQESRTAIEMIKQEVLSLTSYQIENLGKAVKLEDKVFELFNIYKRYNRELIDHTNQQDTLYALVRAHLQWKALKLACAFAIVEQDDVVTVDHYMTAVQYCEMFDNDITRFDTDINKAPHEYLSDFLVNTADSSGKSSITIHDIKKRGFSSSVTHTKLQELVALCAGYDQEGIYTVGENSATINYEKFTKTDVIGVSYKEIDNSKLNRAIEKGLDADTLKNIKAVIGESANNGLVYGETTFPELADLLAGDFAYSPFEFQNGHREKSNLIGGTKWIVLDVDKTHMSADDCHYILDGINHHIALTSDYNNEYKYRVLIELDSKVELSAVAWRYFYTKVAEDLGIDVDVLPQSQIFFSYAGRKVLSSLDGTPIACRDYIMYAKEQEANKVPTQKGPSKSQMNHMLEDMFNTFWYAFECEKGRRSVTLYRAVKHAYDLGADLDYTLNLLDQINEYLVEPLGTDRFNRLKDQVINLFNNNARD